MGTVCWKNDRNNPLNNREVSFPDDVHNTFTENSDKKINIKANWYKTQQFKEQKKYIKEKYDIEIIIEDPTLDIKIASYHCNLNQ